MKINIRYYLYKSGDKLSVIILSLSWEGYRLRISTGISINPKSWNKKEQKVRINYKNASEINHRIENLAHNIQDYYYKLKAEGRNLSTRMLKEHIYSLLNPIFLVE